jgi:hypothetical protein
LYLPNIIASELTIKARLYVLSPFEAACWQLIKFDISAAFAQVQEALRNFGNKAVDSNASVLRSQLLQKSKA